MATIDLGLVKGKDGVSPIINVSDIDGGHRVTITDVKGSKSFDVKDSRNKTVNGVTPDDTGDVHLKPVDIGAASTILGEAIPEGANLNDYVTPGEYYSQNAVISESLANTPFTGNGFKMTVYYTSSKYRLMQEIRINKNTPNVYRRTGTTDKVWNAWYKVVQSTGDALAIRDGGTGAATPLEARRNIGICKSLWDGTWASGKLTINETSNYKAFMIIMDGLGTAILAFKHNTHIRGIGGSSTDEPVVTTYQFAATFDGNDWTFVECNSMNHETDSIKVRTVTEIIGLF